MNRRMSQFRIKTNEDKMEKKTALENQKGERKIPMASSTISNTNFFSTLLITLINK